MAISTEIDKIRDAIKQIEDPAVAMALRHVCKALEGIREAEGEAAEEPRRERKGEVPH